MIIVVGPHNKFLKIVCLFFRPPLLGISKSADLALRMGKYSKYNDVNYEEKYDENNDDNYDTNTDMENNRKFTRAGLFISRFYPKLRELRQFQNRDKTA